MKTQASDADKVLIESVIVKLEGKVANKKTPKTWPLFIIPQT